MKIDISQENFGTLCICAIRYCQGRQTYMPSLVQDICKSYLEQLSDTDIYVMLEDCELQEQIGLYGDPNIDKPGWVTWKEVLQEEYERRNKESKK